MTLTIKKQKTMTRRTTKDRKIEKVGTKKNNKTKIRKLNKKTWTMGKNKMETNSINTNRITIEKYTEKRARVSGHKAELRTRKQHHTLKPQNHRNTRKR